MAQPDEVTRALLEGAHRSRMACSVQETPHFTLRLWRRYRWPLIGGAVFVIVEFFGSLIGSNLRHF